MVASATIGAAVVGGASSLSAASKGAKAQKQAAQQATDAQMAMFNQTQENLRPYMTTGNYANTALQLLTGIRPMNVAGGAVTSDGTAYDQAAYNKAMDDYNAGRGDLPTVVGLRQSGKQVVGYNLSDGSIAEATPGAPILQVGQQFTSGGPARPNQEDFILDPNAIAAGTDGTNPLTSPLLKPIEMDQETLMQTPGYQFNLAQGLKSVQNAAAARGLGTSGAALKGASQFATGLADSTYQNQWNNAIANQTNQFNRLYSMANSGQNAAAGLGGLAQQTGSNIGSNMIGAGNAAAGAYMAGANAIGNAAGSIPGAIYSNRLMDMYGDTQGAVSASVNNPDNAWMFSDIHLKEAVEPVGVENGHQIYKFRYKGDKRTYIGVLAQDIMNRFPESVRRIGDFYAVNYKSLGVKFREVG